MEYPVAVKKILDNWATYGYGILECEPCIASVALTGVPIEVVLKLGKHKGVMVDLIAEYYNLTVITQNNRKWVSRPAGHRLPSESIVSVRNKINAQQRGGKQRPVIRLPSRGATLSDDNDDVWMAPLSSGLKMSTGSLSWTLHCRSSPVSALPLDLLALVFSHLASASLSDLASVARVCQKWNKATRMPHLWRYLGATLVGKEDATRETVMHWANNLGAASTHCTDPKCVTRHWSHVHYRRAPRALREKHKQEQEQQQKQNQNGITG